MPGSANSGCTISFTFNVLKSPTIDADPSPGIQTRQLASALGSGQVLGGGATLFGGGQGSSIVTVTRAPPP